MQQSKQNQRRKGDRRDPTHIKPKFKEQRQQEVIYNPLRALNQKQAEYIRLIETKPCIIATGFAGSSKSYIPTVMAADAYKLGTINKIIITRPAISTSKTVGFTSGDFSTKMRMWLGGVVPILKERLGPMLDIALEHEDISFIPLEVIKIVTRLGKNATLILAGDVRQSELKGESGLVWLVDFVKRHNMQDTFGFIDFNSTSDIVRSESVKQFIINLVRDEKKSNLKN